MTRALSLGLALVCLLAAGSAVHADFTDYPVQYSFAPGGLQVSTANNTLTADRLVYNTGSATLSTNPAQSVTIHTYFAAMSFGNGTIQTNVSLSISGMATPVTVGTLSGNPNSPGGLTFNPNTSALSKTYEVSVNGQLHGVTIGYGSELQTHWMGLNIGELTFTLTDPPIPGAAGGLTGGTTASTPEPSGLVIAGIGVPLLAVFLRRRRAARTA